MADFVISEGNASGYFIRTLPKQGEPSSIQHACTTIDEALAHLKEILNSNARSKPIAPWHPGKAKEPE